MFVVEPGQCNRSVTGDEGGRSVFDECEERAEMTITNVGAFT